MAKVLIVDDDPDLADVLGTIVRMNGHRVRAAHDGLQALQLIAEERPDVVLFDVEMPVLSGPDAIELMVLRNAGDEKIPVVLLSGVLDLAGVAAAVGTPYYLPKPYELADVLRIMERALTERRAPTLGRKS